MNAIGTQSATESIERYALKPHDLVIEVGSGDGSFLRSLRDRGIRVLGVESERRNAVAAFCNGIDTIHCDFTPALAASIRTRYGPARLVILRSNSTSVARAAAYSCLTSNGIVLGGMIEPHQRAA